MDRYSECMSYSHGCYDYIRNMICSCETVGQLMSAETAANFYLKVCGRNHDFLKGKNKKKYKEYINTQIEEFQLLLNNQKSVIDSYNIKGPVKINGFR